ncbi:MAG: patatin-like phospholipase family protein [Acidobacteriaceae bacterium]
MRNLNRFWNAILPSPKELRTHIPAVPPLPVSVKEPWQRPKIGLALGGGFARGMAHIGVLKVLEEEGIPIDFIAGTSIGAVVGAFYCSGISAREISEIGAIIRFSDFARYTISRLGLCTNERLCGLLDRYLKVHTFEELKIPLAVTATEFLTGKSVVFTSGRLNERVRASCAYPGVFTPVTVDGKLMVDGLLAHSVPAAPLKEMGAEKVLSVYFNAHWVNSGGPRHVLDIIGQCFSIAQANMSPLWRVDTDCLIEPEVQPFGFDDFARTPELVRVGEEAARQALPVIRQWMTEPLGAAKPATITLLPSTKAITQPIPPLAA